MRSIRARVLGCVLGWGMGMPLSNDLGDKNLMFDCPECHRTIVKKGSWIKSVATFRCEGCSATVRMTYRHKLAIFERHSTAHRVGSPSG